MSRGSDQPVSSSVEPNTNGRLDSWTTMRLFLMPFCVSSFSALVKDRGFVLIFSPLWREDFIALGACAGFVLLCYLARRLWAQ